RGKRLCIVAGRRAWRRVRAGGARTIQPSEPARLHSSRRAPRQTAEWVRSPRSPRPQRPPLLKTKDAVPMSAPMEDSTAASLHASAAGSRALPASPHARSILDECVDEFTRRLQACLALPDDDDRFWERV